MKRLIFVFLFIGTVLLYWGCAENNPMAPTSNQNDREVSSFEKLNKTLFTGTCKFVKPIDPGTTTVLPNGQTLIEGMRAEWYDKASDPRVTGRSIWLGNQLIDRDGTVKYWGKAEIIVDKNGGKWEMCWHGNITGGIGVAKAFGIGVEGKVKGLFAKSTYTIDVTGGPPPTAYYVTEGFIL